MHGCHAKCYRFFCQSGSCVALNEIPAGAGMKYQLALVFHMACRHMKYAGCASV